MKRYLLLGVLVALLFGCGSQEISPEEKARRKAIAKARRESAPFEEAGRFQKAIEVWKKVIRRYPNSPEVYRKIAEIALAKCRADLKDNRPEGQTFVEAVENAVSCVKELSPKSKELPSALLFLGDTIQFVFSHVPIPKWEESIQPLESFVDDLKKITLKEGKYALGLYYLYRFRLDRAEDLLDESGVEKAKKLIPLVRKLQKTPPATSMGKKLVFRKLLRRGDGAVFFYHEMKELGLKEENRIPGFLPGTEVPDLENFWAKKEMIYCLTMGVIKLLGQKAFPYLPMQRIEVAILAVNTLRIYYGDLQLLDKYRANLKADTFSDPLKDFETDILDESALPYAAGAVQEKIMAVEKGKRFYPQKTVTGLEFFEVLARLKKRLKK